MVDAQQHDENDQQERRRDARRMAQIDRYGLARIASRRDLDGLAELAARLCDAPMAMITYITDEHVIAMTAIGFERFPLPRALSICNAVLHDGVPLVAFDLAADDRFRDSFAVTEGIARFYTSHQLVLPGDDDPVGSLCVFDPEPHTLDPGQVRALGDLADRIVDVLELDLRNRELRDLVSELERSNEQLAAFAGQVSHDLRNPLGAISGSLEMIDDLAAARTPDVDRIRELVSRARRGTSRMSHLVDDVLDYAALGGRLEIAPVDVADLVAEVLEDLADELHDTAVQVGALPSVRADAVQLRIVVQNLVSNAVKHGAGTPIDLAATLDERRWVLAVADHGPGVRPADRRRALEPFVRLDPARPGTGMGLSTCRRIAAAHGGDVGLDETPGGGTTAWVALPIDVAA